MIQYLKKLILFAIIIALGCKGNTSKKKINNPSIVALPRDYVTVGRMMDTIQPPYVIELSLSVVNITMTAHTRSIKRFYNMQGSCNPKYVLMREAR
jgi:hypothetical protein